MSAGSNDGGRFEASSDCSALCGLYSRRLEALLPPDHWSRPPGAVVACSEGLAANRHFGPRSLRLSHRRRSSERLTRSGAHEVDC